MASDVTFIELAADSLAARGVNAQVVAGPPFQLEFGLQHGERWPEVKLLLRVADLPLVAIQTTEPRLKTLLQSILAELS